MPGGRIAKWLEQRVDRALIARADHAVTISEPMAAFYRRRTSGVTTISNGYDHEVIENARRRLPSSRNREAIVIRHMGIISPGRVPHRFMAALDTLSRERPELFGRLRIEFYGNAALVDQAVRDQYPSLREVFSFHPSVPYDRSMELVVDADYLLFSETSSKATLSAQGILTTKLFEYIGSGRPILADISIETLAGRLLRRSGERHLIADSSDGFLQALRREEFYVRLPDEITEVGASLSRQRQAGQYANLVQRVIEHVPEIRTASDVQATASGS
jgi:hypothetical protein